jgi:uncharacterized membrane protein YphA (DoxX/SURF4 family)
MAALIDVLLPYVPYFALVIRIWFGANMMIHGYPKVTQTRQVIQMMAGWMGMTQRTGQVTAMVSAAAVLEFFGGIFMIVGLIVNVVALFYAIFFASIIIMKKTKMKSNYIDVSKPSYELDALYLMLAIVLLVIGAGAFSLDSIIGI